MKRYILALSIFIFLSLALTQIIYASDIPIKLNGQKELGFVHTPLNMEGTIVFPIGEILKFLDNSGTETVITTEKPVHSFISFQGQCYNITYAKTEVQEYEMDESGVCFKPTGKVYQLEEPATYLDDYNLGIYVPFSLIRNILSDSKYGIKFDGQYSEQDNSLEFTKYITDEAGVKHQESTISPLTLAMKINSPWLLTQDDGNNFDDSDHTVTPIVLNGSTLLPIAPIISKLDGVVTWKGTEKKVTITLGNNVIELWINNKTAFVNGEKKQLQVAPSIIKGKTMIPVRFVSENLGGKIIWDKTTQMVVIYFGGAPENEQDTALFNYKISMLDAAQKKEDNQKSLADVISDMEKKHASIKYNAIDPLDYEGKLIKVGDFVSIGSFSGMVTEIQKTKVRVYWDTASLLIDKGKETETAKIYGVTWLANQWVEAKTVTIK